MDHELEKICFEVSQRFPEMGQLKSVTILKRGHIHDTIIAVCDSPRGPRRFVLQRLNSQVFPNLPGVMNNIQKILKYLESTDCALPVEIIQNNAGTPLVQDKLGQSWRCFSFVEDTEVFDICPSAEHAFQASKFIAKFLRALEKFPVEELIEPIPNFQNLPQRFVALEVAAKSDTQARLKDCREMLQRLEPWADRVAEIEKGRQSGKIALRVTHGDLKINNLLFRAGTPIPHCLVDLDTCMPGTLAYDFGDWVRNTTISAAEDEQDFAKVRVDNQVFQQIIKGFSAELGDRLSAAEQSLLEVAPALIAATLAARFLTDYLRGDTYFHISRSNHNLERAKTQLFVADQFWARAQELQK